MGEIGIDRDTYLYRLRYWEIIKIIQGYRKRNILHYQLQRLTIWASMFCLGNPNHKEPEDIIKLYFDRYVTETETQLTDEDRAELLADMAAMNEELAKKQHHG